MKTGAFLIALAAAAAGLGGCGTTAYTPASALRTPSAGQGIAGTWYGSGGMSVTRFSGGTFETSAVGSGSKLAEGSYRMTDSRTVAITMRSLVRRTNSNVLCTLRTADQLTCRGDGQRQFVLTRRPANA